MSLVRVLLRLLAYVYHAGLTLFLLAVSGLALSSGSNQLNLKMLPWSGDTLIFVLFFGSLIGLLTLILALGRKLPFLFFLWNLAVAFFLIKGYIFSSYGFTHGEVKTAGWLIIGSLLALVGSWPPPSRPHDY